MRVQVNEVFLDHTSLSAPLLVRGFSFASRVVVAASPALLGCMPQTEPPQCLHGTATSLAVPFMSVRAPVGCISAFSSEQTVEHMLQQFCGGHLSDMRSRNKTCGWLSHDGAASAGHFGGGELAAAHRALWRVGGDGVPRHAPERSRCAVCVRLPVHPRVCAGHRSVVLVTAHA